MQPPNNRFSKTAILTTMVGLVAGGVLGYSLKSRPQPTQGPTPTPALTTAAPEAALPAKTSAGPVAPYDMQLVVQGGSKSLADFETWLSTASCAEVSRLLVDRAFSGSSSSAPMSALVVRRFRDFSINERFAALQSHLGAKEKIQNHDLLEVISDLARDTLPARKDEMLALFKLGSQLNPRSIGQALGDWAGQDFAAAAAFAGSIEGHGNEQIMSYLIGGLAIRDLPMAQREALKMGKGQEAAIRSIAIHMARQDLAGALDWLNGNGQTSRRRYDIGSPVQSAISMACSIDSPAVARLILDRPGLFEGEGGSGLVGEVFKSWAERDPASASAWLAANPLSELHHIAALKQMEEVRVKNLPLDAALAEVRTLPAAERAVRAAQLADLLVKDDPATAMARFASLLPDGKLPARETEKIMGQLPDDALVEAIREYPGVLEDLNQHGRLMHRLTQLAEGPLAEILPQLPENARDVLQKEVLKNAVALDPERALKLAESMKKESIDSFAGSSIAVHLAKSDPQKAVAWVEAFPEGANKQWAAQNLIANWVKYDPGAALAWLETMFPGPARDRATLEAAKIQGATGSHESAIALAAGLVNVKERAEATGFALQNLWNRDPAAAAAALSGSGLATDQKADVELKLQQGRFSY